MPRVWFFLGWFVWLFFFSASFLLALRGLYCIRSVYSFFWLIYCSLSIKKKGKFFQVNKLFLSIIPNFFYLIFLFCFSYINVK